MKKCKILEFLCFSTQKREEPDCYVYPAGLLRKKKKIHAGFLRNPSPFGVTSYKYKQRKMRLRVNSQTHFLVYPCDPCRIQTCNPHIRSVVLYSVELMDPEVSP